MIKNDFGKDGIQVTQLGFGAGLIGDVSIHEKVVESILNTVLDSGINIIDTARGYGLSEERIGKFLSKRRDEYLLSTKVGYDLPGFVNWTYDIIIAGIENALKLLKTDFIDIVHLHSCEMNILRAGEVIEALEHAKEKGKVRYIAYSGENEELSFAVHTNRFDSIQTSLNICDQRDINSVICVARDKGMGIIAKRPLANVPWKYDNLPEGLYVEEYWKRWKSMKLKFDLPWEEIALRFAVFSANADSCIVGTTSEKHLKKNIDIVEKGPLPIDIVLQIKEAFQKHDNNWIGQI